MRSRGFADVDDAMVASYADNGYLPQSVVGDDYDTAREEALLELLDIDTTPIDYGSRRHG